MKGQHTIDGRGSIGRTDAKKNPVGQRKKRPLRDGCLWDRERKRVSPGIEKEKEKGKKENICVIMMIDRPELTVTFFSQLPSSKTEKNK